MLLRRNRSTEIQEAAVASGYDNEMTECSRTATDSVCTSVHDPSKRDRHGLKALQAAAPFQECTDQTHLRQTDIELSHLGMSLEDLSTSARTDLTIIVGAAQMLGLTTTQQMAILKRVKQLRQMAWSLEDKQEEAATVLENITRMRQQLKEKVAALGRAEIAFHGLSAKRQQLVEQNQNNAAESKLKLRNYASEIKEKKDYLQQIGYHSKLQHSELMKRAQALQMRQQANEVLMMKLNLFRKLPADMTAAKKLYAETEEDLKEAETEFGRVLGNWGS